MAVAIGLATYYGFTLGVEYALPGLVLAVFLWDGASQRPEPLLDLKCDPDPRAIKRYWIEHPGVGIAGASNAVA
ncbi:MAG: hypothetical protein JWP75_3214 [Frondihabitans sp.]|nr:hypothetical protein [Frondihabitans sp.]